MNKKKVRRRSKKKNSNLYFNMDTQKAIVEYQGLECYKEKEKIYINDIFPAFEKLTENLINIHKFTSLHDSYDDLKNDCVNFLFETIQKFDHTRGTNAFSYFNVVAKNFLIIKTKKRLQVQKRNISFDDPLSFTSEDVAAIDRYCVVDSQELQHEKAMMAKMVIDLLYEIRNKIKTENELACINSIITIFENINEIDILNKTTIMLYIRELSGLTPKQLTTTLNNIKKQYRRLKFNPDFSIFD